MIRTEVQKVIEGIKEIVKGYSDDDIHAMLQECKMDPDETAQKLLAQGKFASLLIILSQKTFLSL